MVRFTDSALRQKDSARRCVSVNQYILQQEVGAGTFCKVTWAVDQTGTGFAVKCFSRGVLLRRMVAKFDEDGASQVSLQERMEEELRILEGLNHPHVMRLEEVIDDPGHDWFYMVLEGLPGGQLLTWNTECPAYSARSTPESISRYWGDGVQCCDCDHSPSHSEILVFNEDLAKHFFAQLVQGTAYIHGKGIIHKDLKPDNICLTRPVPCADPRFVATLNLLGWPALGELKKNTAQPKVTLQELLSCANLSAKIGDFNSAVAARPPKFVIYDAEGTQQFTPPECFVGSSKGVEGKPRDLWSLGCVLFTMLFGRCPFWAQENILLQLMIMQEELVIPKGGPAVSGEVQDLVCSLLNKEPRSRLNSAGVLQHPWLCCDGHSHLPSPAGCSLPRRS
eukprot:TRINITY_DN57461_c0_g1_i1.p1 TRINITY_DN57461_c0_g1~~TRINITY_DN57461_c0_g1_i1.p1  ORF type:complete len:393 (-),score=61.34 TRINITY_DN57461_c0_g1_i1:242-1420(-)